MKPESKSEKGVADTVFAEYADRFFADIKSDGKKMTISINASTMQLVKNVLFYLQENTAMATYIENILLSHFSEYRDLLNEEVSAR